MHTSADQDLNFTDETLGFNGILIWFFFPGLFISIFIMILCINTLLHITEIDQELFGELLGGSIFLLIIFVISCGLVSAVKTAQQIKLKGSTIFFRSYYGIKKQFNFEDLQEVKFMKNNWLFTKSPIYNKEGEHLELVLFSKEKIYISDTIEGYCDLKKLMIKNESQTRKLQLDFLDSNYGSNGYYIWFKLFSLAIALLFLINGIICLCNGNSVFKEQVIVIVGILLVILFIVSEILFLYIINNTVQKMNIHNDLILIRFHFGRTKDYKFNQIKSVAEVKNDWRFTESSHSFKIKGNHVIINLKNNKKIYIGDNIDNYDKVKNFLLQITHNHSLVEFNRS